MDFVAVAVNATNILLSGTIEKRIIYNKINMYHAQKCINKTTCMYYTGKIVMNSTLMTNLW